MTNVDLTRVVIATPQRVVEMALPSAVPLADLIPALVQRTATGGTDERGRSIHAPSGERDWVLQRLGTGPLDEELTATALRIRDGETLYLRPREAQLPPVHFDDLIDGLAHGVSARPDQWRDSMTRMLFLGLGAVALLTCLLLLLRSDSPGRGGLAAAGAVMLTAGALMCSRALGDGWATLMLGLAALPFAGVAGFTVLAPAASGESPAPQLLCATVAVSVAALFVTFAAGHHRALFLSAWLVTTGAASAALLVVLGLTLDQAAATAIMVALLGSVFAPSIAFRLALMRLPQLPTSAADLSSDIEPYPGPSLMSGAAVADTYLTWLLIAVGVISTLGVVTVARVPGWPPAAFVISVAAVFAFRARALSSGWQRLFTVLPAVVGVVALILRPSNGGRLASATYMVALLGVAVVMVALSRTLPGRRLLPYWGRLADVLEYFVAIAMVVLLLDLLGAFGWARALGG